MSTSHLSNHINIFTTKRERSINGFCERFHEPRENTSKRTPYSFNNCSRLQQHTSKVFLACICLRSECIFFFPRWGRLNNSALHELLVTYATAKPHTHYRRIISIMQVHVHGRMNTRNMLDFRFTRARTSIWVPFQPISSASKMTTCDRLHQSGPHCDSNVAITINVSAIEQQTAMKMSKSDSKNPSQLLHTPKQNALMTRCNMKTLCDNWNVSLLLPYQ